MNSLLHDPIMTFTYKNTLHVHLWVGHTSYSSHCYAHLSLTPHRCFFFTYIPIPPLALCSVPASSLGWSSVGGPTTLHAATQTGYPQLTLTHTLKTWLVLATPHIDPLLYTSPLTWSPICAHSKSSLDMVSNHSAHSQPFC